MDKLSLKLVQTVEKQIEESSSDGGGESDSVELDVDPLCKRFALDVIGRVVFSMDFEAIEKPEGNIYMKMGGDFLSIWRFLLGVILPKVCYWFQIPVIEPRCSK